VLARGCLQHLVETVEHALVIENPGSTLAVAAGSLRRGETYQLLGRLGGSTSFEAPAATGSSSAAVRRVGQEHWRLPEVESKL
jgi:hypothetical protein